MRPALAFLLLSSLVLAGCTTPGTSRDDQGEPAVTISPGWPELAHAKVRPGVQVHSATGQCTANFIFASPDNKTLYLGLAAHCVEGMHNGDPVRIANGAATGTLAYSSWNTMDDIKERDNAAREYNDFALIQIDDTHRHLVHPAMLRYGGPIQLADSAPVKRGDKVLTYGNSGLRAGIDPASWHEGYVFERPHAWTTTVYTATPGVPGDSGSGVLTEDGQALGIVVTLTILPTTGSNGVTSLDLALAYAKTHAGIDARLQTWELLERGVAKTA